jgi:cytoskeletal protein CcmA (bactofilin family)
MSERPKRRLMDQFSASPSFIAEGAEFTGNLETRGALVVWGTVTGNGRIGAALSLARGATWNGDIVAKQAVIAGHVNGEISVDGKLEIGASAVISGRVTARTLVIAQGAVIESEVTITSGEPVVRFEEKRVEN